MTTLGNPEHRIPIPHVRARCHHPAHLERGFLRWVQVLAAAAITTGGVVAIHGTSVRSTL